MAWAPDYTTATALKSYLRITDTDDDTEIAVHITAASRSIDRACNRQFGVVAGAEQRYYEPEWDRRRSKYVVKIDDLSATTGFVVLDADGTAIAAQVVIGDGGYVLEPRNAAQKSTPWTQFVVPSATTHFNVTGLWGWSAVPASIEQACLLQTARFYKRRHAAFGVAGSPDAGSELRLLNKLDPDVEVVLGPYRRWWAAA